MLIGAFITSNTYLRRLAHFPKHSPYNIEIKSSAPKDVIYEIIREAEERCPVHGTLAHGTQINLEITV